MSNELSQASLLGSEFATAIATKSLGLGSVEKQPQEKYPAFRPVFWAETKYNPALGNTHICYEYDAQFGEMEKHWSRSGKKFSDEPRIGKPPLEDSGPTKPEELPKFCEKETKVFGRKRVIRPFTKAQNHVKPYNINLPYKPVKKTPSLFLFFFSLLFFSFFLLFSSLRFSFLP